MSDIVDLDVNSLAERVYAITNEVVEEPFPDDVSRSEWRALRAAAHLVWEIEEKIEHQKPAEAGA